MPLLVTAKHQKAFTIGNTKMSYNITHNDYLTTDELTSLQANIIHNTSVRDRLLIQLAIATGARASELLAITKSDLNPSEGTVLIHGLKNSFDRAIPLPKALFDELSTLEGDLLFPISYSRLKQIWQWFRPNKHKGIKSLRHTFAINLYKRSRDIRLVQVALGHKSIQNTMVYMKLVVSTEDLRNALL